ncbi:MAG TPA: serine/threonine-protein kinase [Polyangia bacterium]|nr:serine/threonine-protein kinase [Polyangia bacterium]
MGVRFGRYDLVRRLGRGGMAEVFLARLRGPENFEKQLVIKRVLPSRGQDRKFLDLFFEEARTQVSLSQGNLVPIFDFGRVGNVYFIAMEYVAGVDLATLLAAEKRAQRTLPPAVVAYLGIELCRGLAYVHRRRLVHRDVTPRNVLLSLDGEVKLSDFGVALAPDSPAATGVRGTLAYMAPEQAAGAPLDGRADLYALGLVLTEAATGARVRQSDDAATQPPVVEGPLGAVLTRATQPRADDRFADADALLAALEQAARLLPSSSEGPSRMLAARVADAAPANAGDEPVDVAPTPGPQTSFREAATADDAVRALRGAATRDQRRRRVLMGLTLVALIGAATIAPRVARRWTQPAPPTERVTTLNRPRDTDPSVAQTVAPTLEAPIATPARAVTLPPSADETKHAAVARSARPRENATGLVQLRCTPWCFVFVDGARRGDDGRAHTLTLAAGHHAIAVQRLDDRQERAVEVSPDHPLDLRFDFD